MGVVPHRVTHRVRQPPFGCDSYAFEVPLQASADDDIRGSAETPSLHAAVHLRSIFGPLHFFTREHHSPLREKQLSIRFVERKGF